MDLLETDAGARRHPWELARATLFERVLRSRGRVLLGGALLDVGAGDAWLANRLGTAIGARRIVCCDNGYSEALVRELAAAYPRSELVTSAPAEPFELVLLLDVLEHVEDDRGFLADLVERNVAPGGHVLVSVPAWPALFSSHDVRLRHVRRYTPAACRALIARSGLRVRVHGGAFHMLALARGVQVAVERAGRHAPAEAGAWRGGRTATAVVSGALRAEGTLSVALSAVGWDVPGLSWWALCQKAI